MPARDAEGFNATINVCQLQDVGLAYGAFGTAVRFEFPASGFFSLMLPIRGTGEIVIGDTPVTLTAGNGVVVSSNEPHTANFSDDYEHLIVRISARALTEKLAAMTGATIHEPLRMDPQQDPTNPTARMLQRYVPLIVDTPTRANPPLPPWWIAQTEQLLMTLFLCSSRHNYSYLLEQDASDAAPRQVRLAEDYIEANAQRPVTLEELANVTGVSALSLFRMFKKSARIFSTRIPRAGALETPRSAVMKSALPPTGFHCSQLRR